MDDIIDHLFPLGTTTDEQRGAAGRSGVALLPIGSHEQHGPFLPLATDTVIACAIAREIAAVHPVRRLPPVTISCSHEHAAWPGTVSISATTLSRIVRDVADALRRSGVAALVLVNGHGGNHVLGNVVQEATVDGPRMALFPDLRDWEEARAAAGIATPADSDMHAGEVETSILLHAHPGLVRPGHASADHLADDRRHMPTLGLDAYTTSGVVGRPSLASPHKGRDLLHSLVGSFAGYLALLDA